MADFTGMTVRVTLKESNAVLHGKVVEVVAGQTLTLQDGMTAHAQTATRRSVE